MFRSPIEAKRVKRNLRSRLAGLTALRERKIHLGTQHSPVQAYFPFHHPRRESKVYQPVCDGRYDGATDCKRGPGK